MTLKTLHQRIRKCTQCGLYKKAVNAVPGEGPSDADVMLIGQNPGREEDKTGKPFVGQSGKYLNNVLKKAGLRREDIFITSVVKHITPNNRKPSDDEIKACLPYLEKQIDLIQPKIIVLMGKTAWLTPRKNNIQYIKTYHPAAAMRFPRYRKKFENDIRILSKRTAGL